MRRGRLGSTFAVLAAAEAARNRLGAVESTGREHCPYAVEGTGGERGRCTLAVRRGPCVAQCAVASGVVGAGVVGAGVVRCARWRW
jgi:hypothetical protein